MTDNLADFNDEVHRISSATATFQKGIYHLFFLSTQDSHEWFMRLLRSYQCLFQLCLTHFLLDIDSDFKLNAKKIPPRLRQLCKNPNLPTRAELDPAALITHSVFEEERWKGFRPNHPAHDSSKLALSLYQRTVAARHNLMYRPMMLEGLWEDCTLIGLLGAIPTWEEVQIAYKDFIQAMLVWTETEKKETAKRTEALQKELQGEISPKVSPIRAGNFLYDLFKPYHDRMDIRPTESLLLTYARMLNPDDNVLLKSIAICRNSLINSKNLMEQIRLQNNWRTEEFLLQ